MKFKMLVVPSEKLTINGELKDAPDMVWSEPVVALAVTTTYPDGVETDHIIPIILDCGVFVSADEIFCEGYSIDVE